MKRRTYRCCFPLLVPGLVVLVALALGADPEPATQPKYTKNNELVLPSGYHTWIFVGSDLSPTYKADIRGSTERERMRHRPAKEDGAAPAKVDHFHNIYINADSYHSFVAHELGKDPGQKTFQDGTILVMELFRAETKDSSEKDPGGVLESGQFEAERVGLEVAVKDKNRPGGGTEWAYYVFEDEAKPAPGRKFTPKKSATAQPDAKCYACHRDHASEDKVWVQFYPMLRDPELVDGK